MWKHGFSPVFRSNLKTKGNWKIFDLSPVKIYLKKKIMSLKFEFECEPHETVEFALTFPYTVERYQRFFDELKLRVEKMENVQIQRNVLIKSNLGHPIDLIWLSRKSQDEKPFPEIGNLLLEDEPRIKYQENQCKIILSS